MVSTHLKNICQNGNLPLILKKSNTKYSNSLYEYRCVLYTLTLTHIMSQTPERFIPANFYFGGSYCHLHVLFSPSALLGKHDVKLSTFHPAAKEWDKKTLNYWIYELWIIANHHLVSTKLPSLVPTELYSHRWSNLIWDQRRLQCWQASVPPSGAWSGWGLLGFSQMGADSLWKWQVCPLKMH